MSDKREKLKMVGQSNEYIDEERPGKKKRSMRRFLITLFASHKSRQQTVDFALSTGLANDTAECKDFDELSMLSEFNCVIRQPRTETIRNYLQCSILARLPTPRPRSH